MNSCSATSEQCELKIFSSLNTQNNDLKMDYYRFLILTLAANQVELQLEAFLFPSEVLKLCLLSSKFYHPASSKCYEALDQEPINMSY